MVIMIFFGTVAIIVTQQLRNCWSLGISPIWDRWHSDAVSVLMLLGPSTAKVGCPPSSNFFQTQQLRNCWSLGISPIWDRRRSDAVSDLMLLGPPTAKAGCPPSSDFFRIQQLRNCWSLGILSIWDQWCSDAVSVLMLLGRPIAKVPQWSFQLFMAPFGESMMSKFISLYNTKNGAKILMS